LKGHRVTLRAPEERDFEARLLLGIDPEIYRMYGGNRTDLRTLTEDQARHWVKRLLDLDYAWVIEVDALIGQIRLDTLDFRDKRAVLAVGIEDARRLGIGLGTESIDLVLEYAFSVLNLHRISVRVVEYNKRAIRAYQKCGFVVEGRERESAFVDGAWHDDIMMAVLNREYRLLKGGAP
jgi:RimJ/RimL family protein N-acetyltransferase